jgi:hypothetical protein
MKAKIDTPEGRAQYARRLGIVERLGALLQRFTGRPVRFTQHIAYWNAPQGGALFHHDAFAEDAFAEDAFATRQLGVAFVQLAGRTLWLALSIEDLAARVTELVDLLAEGELPWVRAELFAEPDAWREVQALAADRRRLVHELGLPHCGRLHALVNRGPEFTALLADCGHAVLLRPGDVLLLPNHGLERTAMHSVFCADTRPTYGLSLALRAATSAGPSAGGSGAKFTEHDRGGDADHQGEEQEAHREDPERDADLGR